MIENISTEGMEYLGQEKKHIRFKIPKNNVSSKAFGMGEFYDQVKEA